MHFQKDRGC